MEIRRIRNSKHRKPLILKGVRQVGKTWILKYFGETCYESTAYFNFDENEEYRQFFDMTKDTQRILQNLILVSGQRIEPGKTLIVFDEIQDCPVLFSGWEGRFSANVPDDLQRVPSSEW